MDFDVVVVIVEVGGASSERRDTDRAQVPPNDIYGQ